jgi:hypothetical protein
MLEDGIIPSGIYRIVNKIEDYFNINLRKKGHEREDLKEKRRVILDNSLIKGEEDKIVIINEEEPGEEEVKEQQIKKENLFSKIFNKFKNKKSEKELDLKEEQSEINTEKQTKSL